MPQEIELGALSNSNFGKTVPGTVYDPDYLRKGWGKRENTRQASAQLQQELWPGAGLNVGYFRTWYGNFEATDNLLIAPGDHDPYCITSPADARLPAGGDSSCAASTTSSRLSSDR